MSKVVRVYDGDYKLVVGSDNVAGTIILDTGDNPPIKPPTWAGGVIVSGNLLVYGTTTTVESENLTIKDNILVINQGDPGPGVTLGTSGIEINRGDTESSVSILWNENLSSRYPTFGMNLPGTFTFADSDNNLKPIATNSINTFGGNLALISSGTGVITVTGTTDYEQQIFNYSKLNTVFKIISIRRLANVTTVELNAAHNLSNGDRIDVVFLPNATFDVNFAPVTVIDGVTLSYPNIGDNVPLTAVPVELGGTLRPSPIIDDDRIPNTRAVVDYTRTVLNSEGIVPKRIQEKDTLILVSDFDESGVSQAITYIDGDERLKITNTGVYIDNINIFNNTITNFVNDNLRIDSVLSLEEKATDPITASGYITIYAKTEPGTGGTGIFFVNNSGTDDELISKTKALLYSLIL